LKVDKYICTICFSNLILYAHVSSLNSVQLLENTFWRSLCRLFLMIIYASTSVMKYRILFCYIKEINGTDRNRSRFSRCLSLVPCHWGLLSLEVFFIYLKTMSFFLHFCKNKRTCVEQNSSVHNCDYLLKRKQIETHNICSFLYSLCPPPLYPP